MKLIFATNNQNKLQEIRNFKELEKEQILSLLEAGIIEDIPETAPDITGNALLKARFIYEKYHQNCFADDTGLEVDALNGAPGVYSARYAGEPSNASENIKKLLHELKNKDSRGARFKTVLALIINGKEYIFEGTVSGRISESLRGDKGFGYDPVFIPEGSSMTFAEMAPSDKNLISHRGKAVRQLVHFLSEFNPAY